MKEKTSGWPQNAEGSFGGGDPFNIIGYEREDQRRLCDSLESIADKLAEAVDESACQEAYTEFKDRLPVYHRNEEALYGLLAQHWPEILPMSAILEEVKSEHAVHECYAHEFQEFMHSLQTGRDLHVYGYMFRYFFETIRRHLVWEELTLMPMAEHLLKPNDLIQLSEIVAENRRSMGLSVV